MAKSASLLTSGNKTYSQHTEGLSHIELATLNCKTLTLNLNTHWRQFQHQVSTGILPTHKEQQGIIGKQAKSMGITCPSF